MSPLSQLRSMVSGVELKGGRIALRGADDRAQAFARQHREAIIAELERLPAQDPAPQRTAPPWPAGKTTETMIALAEGLRGRLAPLIESEGDQACFAHEMLGAFLKATSDHEFHGRNWWAKHSEELGRRLRLLLPEIWPDPELSGRMLSQAGIRLLGATPIGYDGEEYAQLVGYTGKRERWTREGKVD